MKCMMFGLPTVPGTLEERRNLHPIGRNNTRSQQILDELRQLVALAEEAGFDVFAMTEHHFHSEGYEASVAPLLLYTDLVARSALNLPRSGSCSQHGSATGAAGNCPPGSSAPGALLCRLCPRVSGLLGERPAG